MTFGTSLGVGMRAVLRVDERGIGVSVDATRTGVPLPSEMQALCLDDLSACGTHEQVASRLEQIAALVPVYDRWGALVDVPAIVETIRKGAVLS